MRHLILRHVTAFIVIVTSIVAVSCIKNSKPQQTIPSDDEERVYMLVATPGAEGDFTRAVAVSDSLFADMLTIACVETGHAAEALDFARTCGGAGRYDRMLNAFNSLDSVRRSDIDRELSDPKIPSTKAVCKISTAPWGFP